MAKKNNTPIIIGAAMLVGVGVYLLMSKKGSASAGELSFPQLEEGGTYRVGEELEIVRYTLNGPDADTVTAGDMLDLVELSGVPKARLNAVITDIDGERQLIYSVVFKEPFQGQEVTLVTADGEDDLSFTDVSVV